ncbi:3'(2'),5'-bisphosphate nucleotidase [Ancylothrix sp. C2]|uniref:3'(2'),5'-bisphosphate nucleotidase n=1 Tax=Ancylothrix sp. D3o TaxID=2953691 RepID=UPI0021BB17F7|nr:3'(2'),5'-bisphosphate nucleotidase [Ancylothrix sp. D3o]MCT7948681.1 3'(2'),5'-bisphosphate nucleotidase [Ancylothrix sp. D3o]
MLYEKEKQVAIKAVLEATKLCKNIGDQSVKKSFNKYDHSPVTLADWGVQAVCCSELKKAFPKDPVVGEEDATKLREPNMANYLAQVTNYVKAFIPDATQEDVLAWIDKGTSGIGSRYWTLDPIDGTKGFLRGDQYAIALALIEKGQVKVGVLACPALAINTAQSTQGQGILFVAVRGQGSTVTSLNGEELYSIHINLSNNLINSRYVESVEAKHSNHFLQAAVARELGISSPSLRIDSQVKYGMVASGLAAFFIRIPTSEFLDYKENIWDHAAGSIIVEEAGGCVTDIYGQPLNFSVGKKLASNKGIIASNPTIHNKIVYSLQQIQSINSST